MRTDRFFAFIDGEGKTWTLQSRGTAQEARQEARRHGGRLVAGPTADQRTLDRHVANYKQQQTQGRKETINV